MSIESRERARQIYLAQKRNAKSTYIFINFKRIERIRQIDVTRANLRNKENYRREIEELCSFGLKLS